MACVITNKPQGAKASSGHNLDIALRYARTAGGVKAINLHHLTDHGRPGAFLTFDYANGAQGRTYWLDYSHALQWAYAQRNANPRRSWWAGCTVNVTHHAPGAWDYETEAAKSWPASSL